VSHIGRGGGRRAGHKQDIHKRKIFGVSETEEIHSLPPPHQRTPALLQYFFRFERFRAIYVPDVDERGRRGGVFLCKTDEVGEWGWGGRGVQKVIFWSDVFDIIFSN